MRYFILIFTLFEVIGIGYFYTLYEDKKNEYHQQISALVQNSFKSAINTFEMVYDDAYATQSDTIAFLVAQANETPINIKKRDAIREELLKRYISFFNHQKLKALNGMQIFDKEGRSLLRFHQPAYYDDMIINKRKSLQLLKEQIIYQNGFEVGIFQESYRFQYPLFYDGEFVGSYEYSVDSQAIIDEMSNFYGDYYQFIFDAPFFEKIILKETIQKNYTKFNIGNKIFYIKCNFNQKTLQQQRLLYLSKLKPLQKILKKNKISVIDYNYKSKSHAVVVMPIKDLGNNYFAYILVHIDNSPVKALKKNLFIDIILVTFISFILYIYIYKEIQNRKYIKELINLQHDLIIVSDGENINDANKAFLNFFGYNSLKKFKKDHPCICDKFLEEDSLLKKGQNNLSWISYLQKYQGKDHKVSMYNSMKEKRIFTVDIEYIKNSHQFLILFRDVTEEMKTQQELEERANFDTLTQIYNRNRFEYFLKIELEKAKRYDNIFSLIMFDIDHFKQINDTYGHDIGDSVLKELVQLVNIHIREVDIFARWGGEEFMIISRTNIYQSEMFAEKLRKTIENYSFKHITSLTCSFGITQYRKDDTKESIIKRCDNMLYSAKKAGRNCVVSIK